MLRGTKRSRHFYASHHCPLQTMLIAAQEGVRVLDAVVGRSGGGVGRGWAMLAVTPWIPRLFLSPSLSS
jgi:hypothetical protein